MGDQVKRFSFHTRIACVGLRIEVSEQVANKSVGDVIDCECRVRLIQAWQSLGQAVVPTIRYMTQLAHFGHHFHQFITKTKHKIRPTFAYFQCLRLGHAVAHSQK